MKYDWVLFDIDNTLFDFDRSERIALEETIKAFDIPFEEKQIELYHHVNKKCWKDFENGLLEQERLKTLRFELFFNVIHHQGNAADFNHAYLLNLVKHPYLVDGALTLLETLHQQIPMAVITNGLKMVQRPRLKAAQLGHFFESITVSEEIGVSKPDTAFFDHVFKQIKHPNKERVLVIGDSLNSDIRGGINYGLDTCWFNPKNKERPKSIKPTYTIRNLNSIKNILE